MGDFFSFRSYQGHTVSNVTDFVSTDHRLIWQNSPETVSSWHVLCRKNRLNTWQLLSFLHINGLNESMGERTSENFSVQTALLRIICPVHEFSGDLLKVIRSGD